MVQKHSSNKYVTLEDVRVSHNPKDDTIHITSGDPDVQAGGFHLNLGKNTQTEQLLRQILTDQGVIQSSSFATSSLSGIQVAHRIQTISVVSPRGGNGKTTTVLALAAALAQQGLKTVVVDMDAFDGQIGFHVGKAGPTIMDAYDDSATVPVLNFQPYLVSSEEGWDALTAERRGRTYATPEFYQQAIQQLKTIYDVVLIDTAVTWRNYSDVAAQESDFVISMVSPTVHQLEALPRLDEDLAEANPDLGPERKALLVSAYFPFMNADSTLAALQGKYKFVRVVPREKDLATFAYEGSVGELVSPTARTPFAKEFYQLASFIARSQRKPETSA
jgi:cellulose biosynthesis protein BcsQ